MHHDRALFISFNFLHQMSMSRVDGDLFYWKGTLGSKSSNQMITIGRLMLIAGVIRILISNIIRGAGFIVTSVGTRSVTVTRG